MADVTEQAGVPRPAGTAVPSSELIERVAGNPSVDWFFASGRQSFVEIQTMLGLIGTSLEEHRRLLDFGCGCGRILLWLEEVGRATELYGTDIDEEAIAWVDQHVDFARVSVNTGLPPMDFPDGFFDLVFNHSVFTHLDETYQDAWLAELRRVTKPSGIVLLTVTGEHPVEEALPAWENIGWDAKEIERTWREKGFLFFTDDRWAEGPFPDFYHTAFHAPWYVFRHWGRYFRILAYKVQGSLGYQDFVLLRRP